MVIGGVDLDIGSALGDRDATAESPTRTTDAHLALHDSHGDEATVARTREITARVPLTGRSRHAGLRPVRL